MVAGAFHRRYGVAAYAAFVSASAYFGAVGLVTGLLPIDSTMSANLPFHSPVVGAIALAAVVGLPTSWVAWLAGHGHPRTADAGTLAGLLLVGWIVVEVAIIREFSVLQAIYAAAGVGLVAIGCSTMVRQVASTIVVLPALLTAPLLRAWHLRWGATSDEVSAPMAGDGLLARAHFVATRAITIDAPPDEVWQWLSQVGFGRAGFYGVDLLDNLGRASATTIHPEWQHDAVGDVAAPMSSAPTPSTSFRISTSQRPTQLAWVKRDATWSWQLTELPDGGTRLVTRLRVRYRMTPTGFFTALLMEFGDFPMMRSMLRGLKRRAETHRRREPIREAADD
jgi:hypothetical protein